MSKPVITLPTLEQMREIVTAADSIKRYRTELAQVEESLATGKVNWPALPVFLEGMREAFETFRANATAPKRTRAVKRSPKPASKPPTESKPRGEVLTAQGPDGPVSGTLGQLCVHFGKDYGRTYQRYRKGTKSLEEALDLPLVTAPSE